MWRAIAVVSLVLGLSLGTPVVRADDMLDAETEAFQERLAQTLLTLELDEVELPEVLATLRAKTGFEFQIDPRAVWKDDFAWIQELRLRDVALPKILDLVVQACGEEYGWTTAGTVVLITSRAYLPQEMRVRIYDLGVFTAGWTNEPYEPLGESGLNEDGSFRAWTPTDEPVLPFGSSGEIIELIRSVVHGSFWENVEGADIQEVGDHRIAAVATKEIHAKVEAFLRKLEQRRAPAVRVEIRGVALPERMASDLHRRAGSMRLADDDMESLLADSEEGPAFVLSVRPGGEARGFAGVRRARFDGFDTRHEGAQEARDPRIETVDQGMRVRVHAVAGHDRERILLGLDVALLNAPSPAEATAQSTPDTHAPEVMTRSSVLLLTPGAWHLAEGPVGGALHGRMGLLVRAQLAPRSSAASGHGVVEVTQPVLAADVRHALDAVRLPGLRFETAVLTEVLAKLRSLTDVNVVVAPRVWVDDAGEDYEINLEVTDLSLRRALDLLTEPFDLRWSYAEGLVTIDLNEGPPPDLEVRCVDISDLTADIVRCDALHPRSGASERDRHNAFPLLSEEELLGLVRYAIGSREEWKRPRAITVRDRCLLMFHRPAFMDAAEQFLGLVRSSRSAIVTTVEILEGDASLLRVLSGEQGVPSDLDAKTLSHVDRLVEDGTAQWLARERVVSVSGSGTPRTTRRRVPFIGDFDVVFREGESSTVPVQMEVADGTRLALHAASGLTDGIYVEIHLNWSHLLTLQDLELPGIGAVRLPTIREFALETGLTVPNGATVVVAAGRADGRTRAVLVTAQRVRASE